MIGAETLCASSTRTTAARASSSATAPPRRARRRRPTTAPGLLAWDLGCDGSATGLLGIPAGGSRLPATARDRSPTGLQYIKMQGQEVFRRAVRAVVDSATASRSTAPASTAADVDWFVPHQANLRIIEAAANRLGIPPERTVVNIDRYGNTSAASIPLALAEAADDGTHRATATSSCSAASAPA